MEAFQSRIPNDSDIVNSAASACGLGTKNTDESLLGNGESGPYAAKHTSITDHGYRNARSMPLNKQPCDEIIEFLGKQRLIVDAQRLLRWRR